MDGIISCFDGLTRFFPGLEVSPVCVKHQPNYPPWAAGFVAHEACSSKSGRDVLLSMY